MKNLNSKDIVKITIYSVMENWGWSGLKAWTTPLIYIKFKTYLLSGIGISDGYSRVSVLPYTHSAATFTPTKAPEPLVQSQPALWIWGSKMLTPACHYVLALAGGLASAHNGVTLGSAFCTALDICKYVPSKALPS